MNEENKVRFGLSNVHVGTVTLSDGTPSFSIPKKYPGAVNLTMDAEGETNTFYADNTAYYVTNTNNGYTGELEADLRLKEIQKRIHLSQIRLQFRLHQFHW